MYFFDSYIVQQKIAPTRLSEYEEKIKEFQTIIISAFNKGLEDSSIVLPKDKNVMDVYYTFMHSLFGLAQKLSVAGNMLDMDLEVSGSGQIELLSEIVISQLKNKS